MPKPNLHQPAIDSASVFVVCSARNAMMSSGATRHHSPVENCQRLRKNFLTPALRKPKVALGLLDILLQFAPGTRCATVSFVGCLLEAFKFSSRPAKA